MKTHKIITFNGTIIKVTKAQAEFVMDMLDHKDQLKEKDYLKFDNQTIYLKTIAEVVELLAEERMLDTSYDRFPKLPEPGNRFTREENITRMKEAAYKSKKAEQEKYGVQKWSTSLDNFMPKLDQAH